MKTSTSAYEACKRQLTEQPRSWLVTGVAGFIGSNLALELLSLGQRVVGIDNFATGHRRNVDVVRQSVTADQWRNFRFVEADILDQAACMNVASNINVILHQAALGSVPRSIKDPVRTHRVNTEGFLNILLAARDKGVARVIYAASSSTYGDHPALPKIEDRIGRPLSPYAVTKYVNELYAEVFLRTYGTESIGLRYFNVFGPFQDPNSAYAAVVPRWIMAMLRGQAITINGDGETSRDFCFIENVVQANILAATTESKDAINQVYNIAVGHQTSLNELEKLIRREVVKYDKLIEIPGAVYTSFRAGDVRHSLASIDKAMERLGYRPSHTVADGIRECVTWYAKSSWAANRPTQTE